MLSKEEKSKYNEKALCKFMGKSMFVIAFSVFLWGLSSLIRQHILFPKKYIYYLFHNIFCHFCEEVSAKVHSHYLKSFQNLPIQGKKTKRLENEIIRLSLNLSSITASKYLKGSIANVGKSTICNFLKKEKGNN